MLVWLLAQELIPSLPADPTWILEYGALGVLALVIVGALWLARSYVPKAIDALTSLASCIARQTAAIEEGNNRSCQRDERICNQLDKQYDALITMNAELRARNRRNPQPSPAD